MADQNQTESNGSSHALTSYQARAIELREEIGASEPRALVPRTFAEAQSFAGAIAKSELVPFKLRDRAPDVLMMILAGAELAIPPVRALTMFHVIEGVPKLSADALAAIVMRSPLCEYLSVVEMGATAVTWRARRRGGEEVRLTWTLDEAKAANLYPGKTDKYGGPSNWIKYTRQMLNARCKAELCRLVWPDLCAGLVTAEEALDAPATDHLPSTGSGFQAAPPPAPPAPPAPAPITATIVQPAAARAKPAKLAAGKVIDVPAPAAAAAPRVVPQEPPPAESPPPASPPAPAPQSEPQRVPDPEPEPEAPAAEPEPEREAAAAQDEGGFGDEDPVDAPPPAPVRSIEEFTRQCAAAKSKAEFDRIKADWFPWSTTPEGKQVARRMRDVFAKGLAEVGS